ncbi:hypothetical protein BU25DRAFT_122996 [Macroventuria anomochaeta]|uniref:Uncharacterized protein n=1 Tax=Macroventuria anomochaeta TaxID=301207 RepID=A0ACB6RST8_9PLEO|nr:uncharacterized protein BU25DRAFT_122996 [Macroventuria anomochaeta]KAF2625116.1 hypothetical protein BU25DRAFT_122996 [Macroventuria anomochaeta]
MSASLSQIQHLLLEDTDVLQNRPDILEAFDMALTACLVLSTWLDEYMQTITKGVLDINKGSWKMKFQTLWSEHEVEELSHQLQVQQGAISVVVGLLQMRLTSEIQRKLRKHETLLRNIAPDTQHLRRAHVIESSESVLCTDEANASVFSKLFEAKNTKDRTAPRLFEAVILKSRVYSNAMNKVLRQ